MTKAFGRTGLWKSAVLPPHLHPSIHGSARPVPSAPCFWPDPGLRRFAVEVGSIFQTRLGSQSSISHPLFAYPPGGNPSPANLHMRHIFTHEWRLAHRDASSVNFTRKYGSPSPKQSGSLTSGRQFQWTRSFRCLGVLMAEA